MKTTNIALTLLLSVIVSGCATHKTVPLSETDAMQLTDASVSYTKRPFPNGAIFTPGDAVAAGLGGAIGGALAGAHGVKSFNEQVEENGTTNPNELFRELILNEIKRKFSISVNQSDEVFLDEKSINIDFERSNQISEYVIDTGVGWMTVYLPMNWGRYKFQFFFGVTIYDSKTQRIVYDETFRWETPKDFGNPKKDEIISNSEIGLEGQIQAACKAAQEYFADRISKK